MDEISQSATTSSRRPYLPVLFFITIVTCGVFWMRIDRSVWPFDQAWYGEVSLSLFSTLRDKPSEWWFGMTHAFGFKAPLIAWLGQFLVPLHTVTGGYEDALLILPLVTSALAAAVSVFTAEKLFKTPMLSAFIAGLTFTSASLCIGLSHEYFVEPMQLLVSSVFFLLITSGSSGITLLITAAFWLTIGMAAKVSTPLYIFLPGAMICYDGIRKIRQKSNFAPLMLLSLVTAGAMILCGAWYVINWAAILEFIRSTSGGPVAELYGSRGVLSTKLIYWAEMFGISFFNHRLGGFVWIALFFSAVCIRLVRRTAVARSDIAALCAAGQIGAVLFSFATQINEETRYLLPILPSVAIASGFIISELRAIALLAIPWTCLQSVFVIATSFSVVIPHLEFSPWLHRADPDSHQSEVLYAVIRNTCNATDAGRYNVIGHEIGMFNANSASFYMAQAVADEPKRDRCYYTSLGYAESDPERSWKRLAELNTLYVIFRRDLQSAPGDPFNAVSPQILARVSVAPHFTEIPVAEFPSLRLFRSLGFPK